MKSDPAAKPAESTTSDPTPLRRRLIAAVVILIVASYVVGIVFGLVPEKQKLGGADLGVLVVGVAVVALLVRPDFLDRLTHVKVGNVEVELQKLQRDQQKQRNELDDVRFVLTLLLQGNELQHLRSLQSGNTQGVVGSHELRTELRRLRTLGLIQNLGTSKMADLTDNGRFDLGKIVELTERGREYMERVGDAAKEE